MHLLMLTNEPYCKVLPFIFILMIISNHIWCESVHIQIYRYNFVLKVCVRYGKEAKCSHLRSNSA